MVCSADDAFMFDDSAAVPACLGILCGNGADGPLLPWLQLFRLWSVSGNFRLRHGAAGLCEMLHIDERPQHGPRLRNDGVNWSDYDLPPAS